MVLNLKTRYFTTKLNDLPDYVKSCCIAIDISNYGNDSIQKAIDIKHWLLDNIGADFELLHIPLYLVDSTENNNNWAVDTFFDLDNGRRDMLVCWILNNDKRLEFALRWAT